jgi:nitrogen regulatory protein P-II 1
MKLVLAIIRPEKLEAVQEELQKVLDEEDHYRLTADAQHGEVELFRGQRVRGGRVQKLRIMIGVNDAYVEKTIDAIVRGARTQDDVGDGKIFVIPLEDCVRIRTGERGSTAI